LLVHFSLEAVEQVMESSSTATAAEAVAAAIVEPAINEGTAAAASATAASSSAASRMVDANLFQNLFRMAIAALMVGRRI
jgi:hypothetical protein